MLKQFARWLIKRRPGKATAAQVTLIERLRRRIAAFPPLPATSGNSAAREEWVQNHKRLRELMETDDPPVFWNGI